MGRGRPTANHTALRFFNSFISRFMPAVVFPWVKCALPEMGAHLQHQDRPFRHFQLFGVLPRAALRLPRAGQGPAFSSARNPGGSPPFSSLGSVVHGSYRHGVFARHGHSVYHGFITLGGVIPCAAMGDDHDGFVFVVGVAGIGAGYRPGFAQCAVSTRPWRPVIRGPGCRGPAGASVGGGGAHGVRG